MDINSYREMFRLVIIKFIIENIATHNLLV